MALRIIADSLDEIPEALREGVTEEGGKHVAGIPAGWTVEDLAAIKKAMAEEKDQRRQWSERAQKAESERDSLRSQISEGKLKSPAEIEDYKKKLDEKVAEDIQKAKSRADDLQTKLVEKEFGVAARDALAKHKGKPALLMPVLEGRVKRAIDEHGNVSMTVVGNDGKEVMTARAGTGAMGLDEFVESLKSDADLKVAFEGSGVGGSGSHHASGGSGRGGQDMTNLSPEARLARANEQSMSK